MSKLKDSSKRWCRVSAFAYRKVADKKQSVYKKKSQQSLCTGQAGPQLARINWIWEVIWECLLTAEIEKCMRSFYEGSFAVSELFLLKFFLLEALAILSHRKIGLVPPPFYSFTSFTRSGGGTHSLARKEFCQKSKTNFHYCVLQKDVGSKVEHRRRTKNEMQNEMIAFCFYYYVVKWTQVLLAFAYT